MAKNRDHLTGMFQLRSNKVTSCLLVASLLLWIHKSPRIKTNILKNFLIEVDLVHNVVLVSGVQQSNSGLYMCTFVQSLHRVPLFATPWTIAH